MFSTIGIKTCHLIFPHDVLNREPLSHDLYFNWSFSFTIRALHVLVAYETTEVIESTLPASERERVSSFVHCADRKRAATALYLIQRFGFLGKSVHHLPRTPFGMPYSTEFADPNFNVSHCGDFVSFVRHPSRLVGTDISQISSYGSDVNTFLCDFESMHLFTSVEWKRIMNAPKRLTYFHTVWVLKESFSKALGLGFSIGMEDVEFSFLRHDYQGHYSQYLVSYRGRNLQSFACFCWRIRGHMIGLCIGPTLRQNSAHFISSLADTDTISYCALSELFPQPSIYESLATALQEHVL